MHQTVVFIQSIQFQTISMYTDRHLFASLFVQFYPSHLDRSCFIQLVEHELIANIYSVSSSNSSSALNCCCCHLFCCFNTSSLFLQQLGRKSVCESAAIRYTRNYLCCSHPLPTTYCWVVALQVALLLCFQAQHPFNDTLQSDRLDTTCMLQKRNLHQLFHTYIYKIAGVVGQDHTGDDARIQTAEEQQQEAY